MGVMNQMGIVERLIYEDKKESNWLDYKMKIDFLDNKVDFLRDVNAFANNDYVGSQYIIYGIKEEKGKLEPVGVDSSSLDRLGDSASYQELVSVKIEPRIKISFIQDEYDNKKFLILEIIAEKTQRPFLFRNDYNGINKGEAWISEGSRKDRMIRNDYDIIYSNKIEPIYVQLTDKILFITDNEPGNLEIIIKNYSPINRLFTNVFLEIFDDDGSMLLLTMMQAFKTKDELQESTFDMNFSLSMPSHSEIKGVGKFYLTSSSVALLCVDEFGTSDINYTFILRFRNTEGDIPFTFNGCSVIAIDGNILRKTKGSLKKG